MWKDEEKPSTHADPETNYTDEMSQMENVKAGKQPMRNLNTRCLSKS
jgi:hypothetical protein